MDIIILDSSALVALLHESDALHAKSIEIARALTGRPINLILPTEVFAETVNILGKKFGNRAAIRYGQVLLADTRYYIQAPRSEILDQALRMLQKQKSSTSFTDCLVMACADQYQTKFIFGFDTVFAANDYHLP